MQQTRQTRTLRVVVLLAPQAPTGIALTRLQGQRKPLGSAQCIAAQQQTQHRLGSQTLALVDVAVFTRHHIGQGFALHGHTPAFAHGQQQLGAALLMADVAWQDVCWGGAFAQVVAQAGKAHFKRCLGQGALIEHHFQVNAGVNFGVVLGALGHAVEAVHLGQEALQRPALAQHLQHARGTFGHQPTRQFLPHTLAHQRVNLALFHHLAHELQGFGRHRKVGKARGKARHAQDAHRVFAKGIGHMAQHLGLHIALATKGVGQFTRVGVLGDGVDGEVASCQVFLQGHLGCGMHHKAAVAACGFAFGAGQGMFFARGRVQEDGKVAPDRLETLCHQGLGCTTHHHPVAVGPRVPK